MTGESPKQSRRSANERRAAAAALRQKQLAKERLRKNLIAGAVVVVVVAVIAVLVVISRNDKHAGPAGLLPQAQVAQVTGVPAATFDAVGRGSSAAALAPQPIKDGKPMTTDGKPRILYVGAEWCPYCAGQRWAMAVALSRFGTFSNLGQVYSAKDDGDLASLAFHGSTYTSDYVVFDPIEVEDRDRNKLDPISQADEDLFKNVGGGGYPFIDLGGTYKASSMFDISIISGMNQEQIAGALKDPSNPVSQAIVGAANVLTAKICELTGGKPANVCTSAGVTSAS